MESTLDNRLAALRAELHAAGNLVAVWALEDLGRAALGTEFLAGPDHLAALDARLAACRDRRGGSAVPTELRRYGVHRAAFRARPPLGLLLGDHARHLRGPPAAEADAGAEADARAGAAGRVRRRGLHRIREGELLVRGRVRAAEHLRRRHLVERVLDRVRQRDVQPADLDDLDPERRKVRLRVGERALFDVVEARREVDDLQPVGLHLAQGHIELLDDLVLDAVLDLRRGGGAEGSDELVDERLRVLQAVPEVSERAELHHVEVRVLEQERVLRPELPVEDPLLEVVHLGLLDDAGQGLDEFAQDGDVLGREGVPVRSVQVCEDLAVAVEDRDFVLPDDDVVVHPDLPCRLERRDGFAARLQGGVEALRVGGLLDHRDDRGGLVERVEHRVVVLVQLVEFRLLDLDRRADAGIAAFRVADLRLEAFDREDDVADALEALDLSVHRHLVPDGLELPADALQLVRELDAEQVVRRADVLSPPVAGVAGDHQLDLLEQSSVLFNAVADIGHGRFSPSVSILHYRIFVFRHIGGNPPSR